MKPTSKTPRRPTLDDVARMAGVSTATVSRCLNAPNRLAEETRERVTAAVERLGYLPNFAGRALASRRTNTVGAVIPTMDNAIFARALQAMQETLAEAGATLLVASSGYDPEREATQIKALLGRGVDGLILIGEARPRSTYALLERSGAPFVLAWTRRERCRHVCVGFDNRAAARAMAERALALGHREAAMIAGVSAWNDRAAARIEGVRAALAAHGLELTPDRVVEAEYSLDGGDAALVELLERHPGLTVAICGNDVLAAGALRAARRLGIAVPERLSITGFDDIELAEALAPGLTTVHVPHRRMGRTAAEALLALRDNMPPPAAMTLETSLVERGSLAPPPETRAARRRPRRAEKPSAKPVAS